MVLAVDAEGFGGQAQGDHFQVGKGGNDTSARHVALLVDKIPGFLLADVEDFGEYCKQVVHTVFVNQFVLVSSLLNIGHMYNFFALFLTCPKEIFNFANGFNK